MNNFRVCTNYNEIVEVVRRLIEQKRRITLWQTVDNKRLVQHCKIQEVDMTKGNIILSPVDGQDLNFANKVTIYFFGEEESIVFKSTPYIFNKKYVSFPMPKEIRLMEKRGLPRFTIPDNAKQAIAYITTISGDDVQKNGLQHSVRLVDISLNGIGLLVNDEKRDFFRKGSEITLTQVDKYVLPIPVQGIVAYAKVGKVKRGILTVNAYRIGIKFNKELVQRDLFYIQSLFMA